MPITKPETLDLADALDLIAKSGKAGKYYSLPDSTVVRVPAVELIDVEVLHQTKADLEWRLAEMPKRKEKPDQETLIIWNEVMDRERQPIEQQLAAIIAELAELEEI